MLLEHAGYLLRPSSSGLAVAATSHSITLFDAHLSRRNKVVAQGGIEDVALSPNGRLVALIDDAGLRLAEVHRDSVRWRIVGKSYACHFGGAGEWIWVARPATTGPGVWLELRDTNNGGTIHKLHLEDPFTDSAFTLAPHADPKGIIVWAVSLHGASLSTFVVASESGLTSGALPHNDGFPPDPIPGSTTDYLLVSGGILERRRWADHSVIDELHWPWLDNEDLAVLPLSQDRALWASRTGRLHLIDTVEMSYLEEVAVSSRPPRPLREYLPNLDEELGWGTDLQQLCLVGDRVILQFGDAQLHGVALEDLL